MAELQRAACAACLTTNMESLYLLVPLSVDLVFVIGSAFSRALHSAQFDDLERPGHDVIADDDGPGK